MSVSACPDREHDGTQVSPRALLPDWALFSAYESGKGRRYALLFSVNGGAYALIGLPAGDARAPMPAPLFLWAFVLVPVGMILFSRKICQDIASFGAATRELDDRPVPQRMFGEVGRSLLRFIRWLFTAGWSAAVAAAIWSLLLKAR